MFLPIIVNIAVLTTSVGFVGTWVITILMSLAGVWLVAWEYDRLKPIVFQTREDKPPQFSWQLIKFPAFFAAGGIPMGILWWAIGLGNFSNYLKITAGLMLLGAVFGFAVGLHYRYMPVGHLKNGG